MTNRKRFFINGFLLTAVGIAVRSVSLGFNSYISRTLGAESIGLFTLIGTVYSFAVTFATSGISLTVTRLVAGAAGEGKTKEVRGILFSSILYSLIFSTASALVLFFGAEYFASHVLEDLRAVNPLKILSLSLIPLSLSSVLSGYFIGVKRVSKNAALQVAGQFFKIALTVCFIMMFSGNTGDCGIIILTIGMTLTEILVFLVALIEFIIDKRKNLPTEKGEERHFENVCRASLPLAVSAYIRSALLTLEHILIPHCLTARGNDHNASLASYGILHGMALPMILYPMATLSSFAGLLVPEFAEDMAAGNKKRMNKVASEAMNITLVYAVGAAAFMLLFSEEIGYVFYNSSEAGRYIAILSPVIPIMYLDHVADSMLKGIGEQVYSMWVNISDSLLSVFLVWVLIPKMGILGYGAVIVVMEGYNFILSVIRLRKKIKFKISFVKSLLLPLFSAAAAAMLSKILFRISGETAGALWLFLRLLFAVCIFIAINTAFSVRKEKCKMYSGQML